MKNQFKNHGVFFIYTFCSFYSFGVYSSNIEKVEKQISFFDEPNGFAYGILKAYAKMPTKENILPTDKYKTVLKQFNVRLRKVLKPEYVPSKEFIEQNIKLAPANKTKQKKDLAFLTYKISKKTFMIVQSGGLFANIMIFVKDPELGNINNENQAESSANSSFETYLNKEISMPLPMLNIKKTAGGFIVEAIPQKEHKKLINFAQYFVNGNEMCLNLRKILWYSSVPARMPMPNQWFSWRKQ